MIYDDRLVGFGVRPSTPGQLSFLLNYCFGGHERRITIGHWPAMSVTEARGLAKKYR